MKARLHFHLLLLLALYLGGCTSYKMCLDTSPPGGPAELDFCGAHTDGACCSSSYDALLGKRFQEMQLNGTGGDAVCASIIRRILCAECDPHALFFHNTNTSDGSRHGDAAAAPSPFLCQGGLCEATYERCREVPLHGSPFAAAATAGGRTLADRFPTLRSFQLAFCRDPLEGEGYCFNGEPFEHAEGEGEEDGGARRTLAATPNLCFERIDNSGAWLSLKSHPGDATLAVASTQSGLLELVRIPAPGSNGTLARLGTWLDLRNRTLFSGERGLLDFAFHPSFLSNGRFFVSYICDSNVHPDCAGQCACNAAVGCNPNTAPASTCNGHTILAEYRAPRPYKAARHVGAAQVRLLLRIGRPYSNHNGGCIFFGRDGYFYYTSGDGGYGGDPWNNAQKGNVFLGKVLRLDVDHIPKGKGYGIPKDNPFVNTTGVRAEIYALGLRNPWRATVDRATGAIWVGDVGQDKVEEVDRLLPGHNYGWHNYEGTQHYAATGPTPGGFTPAAKMLGTLTFPTIQYTHTSVGDTGGHPVSVSVIGGYVYRANRNKCLQGKYIYNDAYGPMWIATVYGASRGSTTRVSYSCRPGTPFPCQTNHFGLMWGWAEDSAGEVYLLSSSGVFRIADQSKCGSRC